MYYCNVIDDIVTIFTLKFLDLLASIPVDPALECCSPRRLSSKRAPSYWRRPVSNRKDLPLGRKINLIGFRVVLRTPGMT
jgi:hypothetical protein